jgi:hypothetical protein
MSDSVNAFFVRHYRVRGVRSQWGLGSEKGLDMDWAPNRIMQRNAGEMEGPVGKKRTGEKR